MSQYCVPARLEVHPEHPLERLMIHKPVKVDNKITWYTERLRGCECLVVRFAFQRGRVGRRRPAELNNTQRKNIKID